MRVTRILCALLLFSPLPLAANEATAPKRSDLPMAVADSATGRDAQPGAKPVNGQALARTAVEKGAGANDRDKSTAVASHPVTTSSRSATPPSRPATTQQIGRANADRLRSLLGTQARGRVVRQSVSRPVGSARAPTFLGGAGLQRPGADVTQFGATPTRQLTRGAASPAAVASPSAGRPAPTLSAARPVPTLGALAIHSSNGLPRAPGLAVLGGPVVGHSLHNSSIDGTQLRHKF